MHEIHAWVHITVLGVTVYSVRYVFVKEEADTSS